MRIRSTKPEFWRSKTIAQFDWGTRLVLKALEAYVDDNGVGKDDIALVAADAFPRDLSSNPHETCMQITEAITRLAEAGLVVRYEANGEQLIYIDRWKEWQYIQHPKAGRFPRPDGTMEYKQDVDPASYRKLHADCMTGTGEQGNRLKERETRARDKFPALTFIPDDWQPNLTHQAKARSLGIEDISSAAEAFRNHALSEARQSANWDAAFASWLASPRTRIAERDRKAVKPQSKLRAAAELAQRMRDEETQAQRKELA